MPAQSLPALQPAYIFAHTHNECLHKACLPCNQRTPSAPSLHLSVTPMSPRCLCSMSAPSSLQTTDFAYALLCSAHTRPVPLCSNEHTLSARSKRAVSVPSPHLNVTTSTSTTARGGTHSGMASTSHTPEVGRGGRQHGSVELTDELGLRPKVS